MIHQTAMILLSLLLWSALLIPTGYLLSLAANALGTHRSPARLWLTAPVLGLSISPILLYLSAKLISLPLACIIVGILATLGIFAMLVHARELGQSLLKHRALLLPVLLWVAMCAAMILAVSVDHKLYVSQPWLDYTKHNAMTDAITRTGVPPASPFLHPGKPVPTFYYYGWFIVSSAIDRIGGSFIDPHDAVMGGIIFTGIAMMCVLLLLAGVALPDGFAKLRSRAMTLLLLMWVTGLDGVPTLAWNAFCWMRGRHDYAGTVERWNEQITGWLDMLLWVPQHCAGAIAGAAALVLLRCAIDQPRKRAWIACILAGACLASCACMSIYLAMGFGAALTAWALYVLVRGWRDEFAALTIAGIVAVLLTLPFVLELNAARHPGLTTIELAVRKFTPAHLILRSRGLDHTWMEQLAFFAALPVNYFVELGFFLLAGWVFFRRFRDHTRGFQMLATLLLVSLLLGTFVRSSIRMNDFGWRVLIPAQMALLLWASVVMEHLRHSAQRAVSRFWRLALYATLALGVFSTVLDLVLLRITSWIDDRVEFRGTLLPAEYGYWSRDLHDWIDRNLPRDAVIQYNPETDRPPFDFVFQRRQVAVASEYFGTLLGIPDEMYAPMRDDIVRLFNGASSVEQASEIIRQYGIDVLIVTDSGDMRDAPAPWMERQPRLYQNPMFRVFNASDVPSQHQR